MIACGTIRRLLNITMAGAEDFEINFIRPELSIQECRKILCSNGDQYTDDEIKEIRKLILNLVEIDYRYYQACKRNKQQEAKIINLHQHNDEERKAA